VRSPHSGERYASRSSWPLAYSSVAGLELPTRTVSSPSLVAQVSPAPVRSLGGVSSTTAAGSRPAVPGRDGRAAPRCRHRSSARCGCGAERGILPRRGQPGKRGHRHRPRMRLCRAHHRPTRLRLLFRRGDQRGPVRRRPVLRHPPHAPASGPRSPPSARTGSRPVAGLGGLARLPIFSLPPGSGLGRGEGTGDVGGRRARLPGVARSARRPSAYRGGFRRWPRAVRDRTASSARTRGARSHPACAAPPANRLTCPAKYYSYCFSLCERSAAQRGA
jgi:hypothetical protein